MKASQKDSANELTRMKESLAESESQRSMLSEKVEELQKDIFQSAGSTKSVSEKIASLEKESGKLQTRANQVLQENNELSAKVQA